MRTFIAFILVWFAATLQIHWKIIETNDMKDLGYLLILSLVLCFFQDIKEIFRK